MDENSKKMKNPPFILKDLKMKTFLSFSAGYVIPVFWGLKSYNLNQDTSVALLQLLLGGLATVSIFIALETYKSSQEKNRSTSILGVIDLFEKILLQNKDYVDKVRATKGTNYIFTRIPLEETSLEYMKKKYPKEAFEQLKLSDIEGVFYLKVAIINSLQKLALTIYLNSLSDDPQLNCIKQAFIETVEIHAEALISQKYLITGGESFNDILKLYSEWFHQVDHRTFNERLKEYS